ncbi:MAG: DUF2490 domain-containing protein [Pseudomonadota bacterium]
MRGSLLAIFLLTAFASSPASAQVDESQNGAWYMLFWSANFEDSRWGVQGDFQNRNWDSGGDLEQWLLRSGVTYRPDGSKNLYTFGYANIRSGVFGPSDASSREDRIYQEALIPQRWGERWRVRHRLRFEQRWVDGQDFRTRFRYAIFADYPLGDNSMDPGAWYAAFYNELFINGETDIGDGRSVDTYDRNRTYVALGYVVGKRSKVQAGYMYQHSRGVEKGQWQLSLHQTF